MRACVRVCVCRYTLRGNANSRMGEYGISNHSSQSASCHVYMLQQISEFQDSSGANHLSFSHSGNVCESVYVCYN